MLSETLCREYAQNRIDLKNNRDEIVNLFIDSNRNIDLTGYRDDYYSKNVNPMYDNSPEWQGWITALTVIGDYSPYELKLATLLDEKKEILKQAGMIKRRICTHGRCLINQTRNTHETL